MRGIAPYQTGKPIAELARETGIAEADIVKLASNENPLGMSPSAIAAAAAALGELARYPDGAGFDLKAALSAKFGLTLAHIVLGNGSNDVLDIVGRVFLGPGTSAVYSQHAFAVYGLVCQAVGAERIEVPARDYGHDLAAMRAAIRPDTRVVWIANPNNPTGTLLAPEDVREFVFSLPEHVVAVLDEAYTEYLEPAQRGDSLAWIRQHPRLLVTRTFAKIHGLAGLRVGFGAGDPALIDLCNRVRQPFNVNSIALAAAVAALGDEDFVARSAAANREGMAQMRAGLDALGVPYIPSFANFLAVEVGDAAVVNAGLLKNGVIVRPVAGYGMPRHLRVSIGLPHENQHFLDVLATLLGKA
ncbi:MAG: histidinol-phosphate transaminase [Rhodocyclaceae bacterium]|nr:histidinol-phosphate transaminase [Rhodocyclaceae bacterium]